MSPLQDSDGEYKFPLSSAWGSAVSIPALEAGLSPASAAGPILPVSDREAWERVEAVAGTIMSAARQEMGTPWPQPLASDFARYFRSGTRTDYEDLVRARQHRLTRAVVMACITAENAWLDEVADGAWLLCEQSTWCWVAHDDVHDRLGHVLPDSARPVLDLGAGEAAGQLAWLDYVLGSELDQRSPGLRERIRSEIYLRVISPFLDSMDWHWLGLEGDVHNWNPWIHSNILAAALFTVEDPGTRARVVKRCVEGLDRFLASLPADGGIDEGFAYWWNGAGRALESIALLEQAMPGRLSTRIPLLREVLSFPSRMQVGGAWHLNFADGPAAAPANLPWDLIHRWADRLHAPEAAAYAGSFLDSNGPDGIDGSSGLGRTLHALFTAAERAGGAAGPAMPPLPGFTYLDSLQVMVAREEPGASRGLVLTAKGGHNGEHHNHLDVGSVTVAVDSVPLVVDAGQPTYTSLTFGPNRYHMRAMQSSWHSVPAPFGLEQGIGAEFAARLLHVPTAAEPRLELALGAAYGFPDPDAWVRSAGLDHSSAVSIRDSWTLPQHWPEAETDEIHIHYLLAGTVQLQSPGSILVTPAGIPLPAAAPVPVPVPGSSALRGALLTWDTDSTDTRMEEWILDDPLLAGVWGRKLTRLSFRIPPERSSGSFTLTIRAHSSLEPVARAGEAARAAGATG